MTTPAGWYDDPEDSDGQRYWDGQNWTPHRQRKPVSVPSAAGSAPPPPPPNQQAQWVPPGQQPGGPPPRRSNNPIVIAGLIAVIVALAVAAFVGYNHFGKSHPSSPEDQIKSVVQREADAWNKSNFSYNSELQCKAMASTDQDHNNKELRKIRAQAGTITISVTNIHVTGDQATADATIKFAKAQETSTIALQFVKEDGNWKDCTPDDPSDNGDGS